MSSTVLAAYDDLVTRLKAAGVAHEAAHREAARRFPDISAERAIEAERRASVLEKDVERAGDKLMLAHGFEAIRLSQPRATKQTPGISDRLYINSKRRLAAWWEAKTTVGVQSPAQRHFQSLVESVGWTYLLGTDAALRSYLIREGLWHD